MTSDVDVIIMFPCKPLTLLLAPHPRVRVMIRAAQIMARTPHLLQSLLWSLTPPSYLTRSLGMVTAGMRLTALPLSSVHRIVIR